MGDEDPRWNRATAPLGPAAAPARDRAERRSRSPFDRPARRFALGDELGKGGMGRVVAAKDTALDRDIAIKQALVESPEDLARFEREVRITAALEHPSIIPIHEAGRDEQGTPYYVMRRIAGEPLADRIARGATVRDRLALVPNFLAAVEAAAFAHAHGVIHRDIKPWNILVGSYGETLLIDWGLARRLDERDDAPAPAVDASGVALTRVGHAYGTPGFMSPEQARGEVVDERADVYALGATLFHVLVGKPPFEASSGTEWIAVAATGIEPPLSAIGAEVPAELVAIIGKAMAVEIERRYRDAGELAADLRAFLAGQLVAAHRYTIAQRIRRFVRRHRVAVAIGAVAAIALGVVGVLAVNGIVYERDRADAMRAQAEAGERLAADRAELMLVERASTLAATSPAHAVALLAGLPAASRHWQRARDIVAVAASAGIPRATTLHRGSVTVLELSPDGSQLLSAGQHGIVVHDVATARARTLLATSEFVNDAVWTNGGKTITFVEGFEGVDVVDVATGQRRVIDPAVQVGRMWTTPAGALRYVDEAADTIVERSGSAAPIVVARDVQQVVVDDAVALVAGASGLRALIGGRELVLRTAPADGVSQLAVSAALGRAAIATPDEVIEWDLATAKERQRHATPMVRFLDYGSGQLFGTRIATDGSLLRFSPSNVAEVLDGDWAMLWSSRAWHGHAIATSTGVVGVIDETGTLRRLAHGLPGTRSIASRAGSPIVAVGSSDGSVYWWNVTQLVPRAETVALDRAPCAYDERAFYGNSDNQVVAIDRQTRTTRAFVPQLPVFACAGLLGNQLITWNPNLVAIDVASGAHLEIAGITTGTLDSTFTRFLFVQEREVRAVAGKPTPVTLWTAPEAIGSAVGAGRWLLALALDNATFYRVDLERGTYEQRRMTAPASLFTISTTGEAWIAIDHQVWLWDTAAPRLVTTLPALPGRGLPDTHAATFELADGSVWRVTPDRAVLRRGAGRTRQTFWSRSGYFMTLENSRHLTKTYLASGESATISVGAGVTNVVTGNDGTFAVRLGNGQLAVYEDPVPADPRAIPAWIAQTTNAFVAPGTDGLTWR